MVPILTRRKPHSTIHSCFSWSTRCCIFGSWGSEAAFKGYFSCCFNVVLRGTQLSSQAENSGFRSPRRTLGGTFAVPLDNSHLVLGLGYKRSDELSPKQSGVNQTSRASLPCLNLSCLIESQTFSKGFICLHTGSFDGLIEAKDSFSDITITIDNGIRETTTTTSKEPLLDYLAVKNILEILSQQDWDKSLQRLNVHLNPTIVCEVIKEQTNGNTALAFFRWIKENQGFEHSRRTFKSMLYRLMKESSSGTKHLDTFRLLINESLENGWDPGISIHSYLIHKYCKIGKVDAALDHLEVMRKSGCAPNVVTYSSLVGGLARAGKLEDALSLLDDMEVRGCHPNVITYSILINGLAKAQQLDQASSLFDKMKEKGCTPNLVTYNCLIDGLAKAGKFDKVVELTDDMRQTGCVPNIFIYGTLMNHFVQSGNHQKALGLFEELKGHGLVPNLFVFTPLLSSLASLGDWERAQQLLAEMKSRNCAPDVIAYAALVAGLVKAGKLEESCTILNEMEENGCRPSEFTYNLVVDALVKVNQKERASVILNRRTAKRPRPKIDN